MTGLRDPSRSVSLRRRGRGLVARRVFELHKRLRMALQEHDVIGLRGQPPNDLLAYVEGNADKLDRSEFMLRKIVEETLATPPDWLRAVIERSVQRGVDQVGKELSTIVSGLDHREVADFHSKAAEVEVEGISSETQRRLLRHAVRAIEVQQTPEALMRDVRESLRRITQRRLILLVNTAVVRAVNAGKLFGYKAKGVRRVGIEAEWLPPHMRRHHDSIVLDRDTRKARVRKRVKANAKRRADRFSARTQQRREQAERRLEAALSGEVGILTAGDNKVCDECDDIAAQGPYNLNAARELIPAHPNCRCAFVPVDDERYARIEEQEQTLTKGVSNG